MGHFTSVATKTGKGCPDCLWTMPNDIRFETQTTMAGAGVAVDIVRVEVLAMSFPCPGCGLALRFFVGRGEQVLLEGGGSDGT